MEDSWADALVIRRWARLAIRLGAADCEQLLQRASRRSLVVGGTRWVSSDTATEGWALESDGRFGPRSRRDVKTGPTGQTGQAGRLASGAQAVAGANAARPGNARSLGSQKLAN